jgi:hypothetical protein
MAEKQKCSPIKHADIFHVLGAISRICSVIRVIETVESKGKGKVCLRTGHKCPEGK